MNYILGIITGIISSIIVIFIQRISDYNKRKRTELNKLYKLKIKRRNISTSPEFVRETFCADEVNDDNEDIDIVKIRFPFDIKSLKIFRNNAVIYDTDKNNPLPANNSIHVVCKCEFNYDKPIFIVDCITFQHEHRIYEFKAFPKYTGGFANYFLKLKKQNFTFK